MSNWLHKNNWRGNLAWFPRQEWRGSNIQQFRASMRSWPWGRSRRPGRWRRRCRCSNPRTHPLWSCHHPLCQEPAIGSVFISCKSGDHGWLKKIVSKLENVQMDSFLNHKSKTIGTMTTALWSNLIFLNWSYGFMLWIQCMGKSATNLRVAKKSLQSEQTKFPI